MLSTVLQICLKSQSYLCVLMWYLLNIYFTSNCVLICLHNYRHDSDFSFFFCFYLQNYSRLVWVP